MPSITKRGDSSRFQFRQRVPADVLAKARGRAVMVDFTASRSDPPATIVARLGEVVKFSLRTRDPETARLRQGIVLARVQQVFETVRAGPASLTHKQVVALAGDVYRFYVETFGDDPGEPGNWAAIKAWNRAVLEGRVQAPPSLSPSPRAVNDVKIARDAFGVDLTAGINALPAGERDVAALEQRFGVITSWTLARRGIDVDGKTRARLIEQVATAVTDAAWHLKRNALGDYTPDRKAARFPEFKSEAPALTLTTLFDRWVVETKPAASTFRTWKGVFGQFREHLGHDDARRVTPENVVAFKDARLASGCTARTVTWPRYEPCLGWR